MKTAAEYVEIAEGWEHDAQRVQRSNEHDLKDELKELEAYYLSRAQINASLAIAAATLEARQPAPAPDVNAELLAAASALRKHLSTLRNYSVPPALYEPCRVIAEAEKQKEAGNAAA